MTLVVVKPGMPLPHGCHHDLGFQRQRDMVTAQVLNHARQLLVRRSMEELRRYLEYLHARRRPCPRRPGFEQFHKVVCRRRSYPDHATQPGRHLRAISLYGACSGGLLPGRTVLRSRQADAPTTVSTPRAAIGTDRDFDQDGRTYAPVVAALQSGSRHIAPPHLLSRKRARLPKSIE